jgi:hypothetical protein
MWFKSSAGGSITIDTTGSIFCSGDAYMGFTTGGGIDMTSSGGNVLVGSYNNCYSWHQGGNGDTIISASDRVIISANAGYFAVDSNLMEAFAIYNNTATFTANVGIATAPQNRLYRITSSRAAKVKIEDVTFDPYSILKIRPRTFYDRAQYEYLEGDLTRCSLQLGAIVEEVVEIDDIAEFIVELTEDGRPQSVNYDRIGVGLIPVILDLKREIDIIKSRLG